MENLEVRVNQFAEQWQDYCLPDKADLLKPLIGEFVSEIDGLVEKSTRAYTQTRARKKKPSYSI